MKTRKKRIHSGGPPCLRPTLGTTNTPVAWRTKRRTGINPLRPVPRGAVARSGMIDMRAQVEVHGAEAGHTSVGSRQGVKRGGPIDRGIRRHLLYPDFSGFLPEGIAIRCERFDLARWPFHNGCEA